MKKLISCAKILNMHPFTHNGKSLKKVKRTFTFAVLLFQGPQGDRGPTGEQGPQGSKVYSFSPQQIK